jgi:hypothetical protein
MGVLTVARHKVSLYLQNLNPQAVIFKYFPILLIFHLGTRAQTQQFNTHIDTVKTDILNIIGNKKVVIGTILMPSTGKPKVLLSKAFQYKDSIGDCVTEFVLVTPENVPFINVNIRFEFDTPFMSVNESDGGESFDPETGRNQAKTEWWFKAAQVVAPSLVFTIKSKENILTTIHGIDGAIQR